jgi:hypothetical protein
VPKEQKYLEQTDNKLKRRRRKKRRRRRRRRIRRRRMVQSSSAVNSSKNDEGDSLPGGWGTHRYERHVRSP